MKKLLIFFKKTINIFQKFGQSVSYIVNSILLLIVYIFGVGPSSVVAKLMGKHFLETKICSQKSTYWSILDLKVKTLEEYYKQF